MLSIAQKATFLMRSFSFLQIPMIFYTRPKVVELNNEKCVVRIPFKRRNKNHVNSIYIAALVVGADCTLGMLAMYKVKQRKEVVVPLFKDLKAEFFKRAEGDVYFSCDQGEAVNKLVDEVIQSGERGNLCVPIIATVPSKGDEPVARFELTLSLKKKR